MKEHLKQRIKYAIFFFTVMILGILSRKFKIYIWDFLSPYIGDVLWATMIYFGFRFIFLKDKHIKSFIMAILFSFFIEISQLYHSLWIDNIRSTTLGGLILGYGFLYSDLACYLIGIMIGLCADKFIT